MSPHRLELGEVFEVWGACASPRDGESRSVLGVTCDHASNRCPVGWEWPGEDRCLQDTHWAYDLGARELAMAVAGHLAAPLVMSRFTRLLVDPNREENHPDLVVRRVGGRTVSLGPSESVGDVEDLVRRKEQLWLGYHQAVERCFSALAVLEGVLSIHTFTPTWQGVPRDVEVGVLFRRSEDWGKRLGQALQAMTDLDVRLNEPYSGKEGLIYAAERHAGCLRGGQAVEIEVRNDLATDPSFVTRFAPVLAQCARSAILPALNGQP